MRIWLTLLNGQPGMIMKSRSALSAIGTIIALTASAGAAQPVAAG